MEISDKDGLMNVVKDILKDEPLDFKLSIDANSALTTKEVDEVMDYVETCGYKCIPMGTALNGFRAIKVLKEDVIVEQKKEKRNLIQEIMKEFERAKNFGLRENNWLAFKQACQKMYMFGKEDAKLDTLYAFMYNPDIHDSTTATISTHRTKEGAEKAMKTHKDKERKKWEELNETRGYVFVEFGQNEHWMVEPIKVLE